MDPYMVQHWLVWSLVAALLMLGAWMRVGSYLFPLGLAALLALVESLAGARLGVQIASFIAASVGLVGIIWVFGPGGRRAAKAAKEHEREERGR